MRVSLRLETLEVPAQDIVTRDNVTVKVNAVVFFRVIEPQKAVLEVSNFLYTTSQLPRQPCARSWERRSWTSC